MSERAEKALELRKALVKVLANYEQAIQGAAIAECAAFWALTFPPAAYEEVLTLLIGHIHSVLDEGSALLAVQLKGERL